MNRYFLSLGGNLGDREGTLRGATAAIEMHCGRVIAASDLFETAAWRMQGSTFLNQALCIESMLEPGALLEKLLEIERQLGRTRNPGGYADRTIDIDILLCGDLVINEPGLTIPHPHLADRLFVLEPLSQIAPDFVHPVSGKTVAEMLAACPDPHAVERFRGNAR
jgi:2-amino-4-hydroxy-6-hydroxymethyldihydropteridine diphosphokinase